MNQYVTGEGIRILRERNHCTQLQLADKIGVGYPDITLLEPLAQALHVSITELISGNAITNENRSSNMLRSKFYVCPVCGNVIHAMGETAIHCHGIQLAPEVEETADEHHQIRIERSEDEYYVEVPHEMTKQHYISFIAAISSDRIQMVKLYPEGNAHGVRKICCFCNRDGLFSANVNNTPHSAAQ